MKSLTPKQHTVLTMIDRHIRRYGYAPSVREVAAATGTSHGAAHTMMQRLEARGRLRRGKGETRSIEVLS